MRWFVFLVIILGAALWWSGVVTVHVPKDLTKNIPDNVKTTYSQAETWVRTVSAKALATNSGADSAPELAPAGGSTGGWSSATPAPANGVVPTTAPAAASTVAYEQQGCAFQAPSDWISETLGNRLKVSTSGKSFSVIAGGRPGGVTTDSAQFSNIVLNVAAMRGFKIKAEGRDPFKGIPAYSFAGFLDSDAAAIKRVTSFVAGEHMYLLVMEKRNGDPTDDPEMMRILNSVTIGGE